MVLLVLKGVAVKFCAVIGREINRSWFNVQRSTLEMAGGTFSRDDWIFQLLEAKYETPRKTWMARQRYVFLGHT